MPKSFAQAARSGNPQSTPRFAPVSAPSLFGEVLAPKPDWCIARTFSIGRSGNISEPKKALILWVSRDRSKPWSGLGVSTTSRLGKRLRHLLHLHQPRRLPLSPPPQRWPPNPRRPSRLLSPLPKRLVVETPSPFKGLLQPLLTQSTRVFFISVICFPTFLWRRSLPCTSLALVLVPLQTGEVQFLLVPSVDST